MRLPVFFPQADVAARLPAGERISVAALCRRAGVRCRVSGPAAQRALRLSDAPALRALRRPGPLGEVWLGVPARPRTSQQARALLALGLLAYGAFDYTARESLRGLRAARPGPGRGRPRTGRALDAAQRQRRYRLGARERHRATEPDERRGDARST